MKTQEEIKKQTVSYVNATSEQLFKCSEKLYKVFLYKEDIVVMRCDLNLENLTFVKVGNLNYKKRSIKEHTFKSHLVQKGVSIRHFKKFNEFFKNIVENYK